MPLRDHFHPPLAPARHWEAFHSRWAAAIADRLNEVRLPRTYFAEMQVHVSSRVEVDVATFDNVQQTQVAVSGNGGGGAALAVAAPVWVAPPAAWSLPAVFPDNFEVQVFRDEGGPTLVAAIELVSPGNKDRAEARRAFVAKCASYLQQGVGLVVVDIVTNRLANLHNELAEFLNGTPENRFPDDTPLYATAYRPVRQSDSERFVVWPSGLAVGQPLPDLPLPLGTLGYVQLELELTYEEACRVSRLP